MLVNITFDTATQQDRDMLTKLFGESPRLVTVNPALGAPYTPNTGSGSTGTASLPGAAVAQTPTLPPIVSAFTDEDVANATRELAATLGIPRATTLLAAYQVERARDISVEQRENYIAEAKKLVTEHKAQGQA